MKYLIQFLIILLVSILIKYLNINIDVISYTCGVLIMGIVSIAGMTYDFLKSK